MWHWANEQVPVDPLDPRVAADARARLADALVEPVHIAPAPAGAPRAPSRNGDHHPGLAPPNIPAPSWWRGDRAAFDGSVQAASDLGYKGAGIPPQRPATAPAARPTSRRPSGRRRR